MLRIMLPLGSGAARSRPVFDVGSIGPLIDVSDVIFVEVVLVIDGDVAVAPIAIAPIVCPCCSQYHSCAKCQPRPRHVAWIIIGRIRPNWWTVNDLGIIRRNIHVLVVGRLNYDSLLPSFHRFSFDFLLLVCR
jgi:hypothetical protein